MVYILGGQTSPDVSPQILTMVLQDDLWRRNHDTISGLEFHAADFNPHFVTSIAFRPLPRAALESFLIQRGLLHSSPNWGDFFHAGFLNKIYSRLNDIVFRNSDQVSPDIYIYVYIT